MTSGQLARNIMESQPKQVTITFLRFQRYREIEQLAREVMTLLEDGGPERWAGHLVDTDDNIGQRLRDALGGFGNDSAGQR